MRKQRMWKRFATLALALVMSLSLAPAALAASGMDNFQKTRTYPGFSDVKEDAWYAEDLKDAYELGLINGASEDKFNPDGDLTLAEAITMAASIRATYYDDDFTPGGSPWYQNAVDYAIAEGFLLEGEYEDYRAKATRADMAGLFAYTLPIQALPRINRINWIPDVAWDNDYIDAIYRLYDAGVLTGGTDGSFRPDDTIKRSEAVCILARMAVPGKRVSFTLDTSAPGTATSAADGSFQISVPDGWRVVDNEIASTGHGNFFACNDYDTTDLQIDTYSRSQLDVDATDAADLWDEVYLGEDWNASVLSDRSRIILRGFSAYLTGYEYVQDEIETRSYVYVFETNQYVYCVQLDITSETAPAQLQEVWEMIYSMVAVLD